MLEKIIDYIGKITLLIVFLGLTILTIYGVIVIGLVLLDWLKAVV